MEPLKNKLVRAGEPGHETAGHDTAAAPSGESIMERVSAQLIARILDTIYDPGYRLPSERDLAQELAASRVAVREAFRRLQEWRMISIRRGSGATVLPRNQWSSMALWAVLKHALENGDTSLVVTLVSDALAIRRSLLLEMIGRAAPNLKGQSLGVERLVVNQVWARRADPKGFVELDQSLIPRVLERADMLASVWILNSLADVYSQVMRDFIGAFKVPRSYRAQMMTMLDCLERGESDAARAALETYLDRLDRAVISILPESIADALLE